MRSSRSVCRPGLRSGQWSSAIGEGLRQDRRADVQAACQSLIDALTAGYRVPAVRVRVLATRPADGTGELHGFYEPEDEGTLARISVWMRTAQKKNVVAFKTFLRTLIHELCHHLDYELFALEETFHTEGFYKRESTLVRGAAARKCRRRRRRTPGERRDARARCYSFGLTSAAASQPPPSALINPTLAVSLRPRMTRAVRSLLSAFACRTTTAR